MEFVSDVAVLEGRDLSEGVQIGIPVGQAGRVERIDWHQLVSQPVAALEGEGQRQRQEAQLEQSVDDYAFVKNAYFENLEFRVTDGKSGDKAIDDEQLDDFADFEAMLEGNDFDSYEETSEEGVDESTDSEDSSVDDSEKAKLKEKDAKSKDGK